MLPGSEPWIAPAIGQRRERRPQHGMSRTRRGRRLRSVNSPDNCAPSNRVHSGSAGLQPAASAGVKIVRRPIRPSMWPAKPRCLLRRNVVGARYIVPLHPQQGSSQSVISAESLPHITYGAGFHVRHSPWTPASAGVTAFVHSRANSPAGLRRIGLQRSQRHAVERFQSHAGGIGAELRVPF